jgi:hypothetical protein
MKRLNTIFISLGIIIIIMFVASFLIVTIVSNDGDNKVNGIKSNMNLIFELQKEYDKTKPINESKYLSVKKAILEYFKQNKANLNNNEIDQLVNNLDKENDINKIFSLLHSDTMYLSFRLIDQIYNEIIGLQNTMEGARIILIFVSVFYIFAYFGIRVRINRKLKSKITSEKIE